jgi:hypothetical protein
MTRADYRDPSREYPPSRPTLRMVVIAVVVIAAALVIGNWPQVTAAAHISQIENEIEQVVGL